MGDFAGRNLAAKYSKVIDERFTKGSMISLGTNDNYDFKGVDTVKVYSFPIAPMNDYTRSGSSRYGTPMDMLPNVQVLSLTKDRSFAVVIDRGDFAESEMVNRAARSLQRQLDEVIKPEYEMHCLKVMAEAAINNGNYATSSVTSSNAYAAFLAGMEKLGNANVPDTGRVAYCSYEFAGLLQQDNAYIRYGDRSQEMILRGEVGECDGCKIVRVSSDRLPQGCLFLITHPDATTAPKQLEEYKIHENPPGISGWLIEGRFIYDAFVLDEKADAIYLHMKSGVLKNLEVQSAPGGASGKSTIIVNGDKQTATNKRYYLTAATKAGLPAVTYGTAITPTTSGTPWYGATLMTSGSDTFTVTATHKFVRVVEVDGTTMKPVAYGDKALSIGS